MGLSRDNREDKGKKLEKLGKELVAWMKKNKDGTIEDFMREKVVKDRVRNN